MGFRVPAKDGKKGRDNRPVLVLPDGTLLKGSYMVKYLTVGGMCTAYIAEKEGKNYFVKEVENTDARRMVSLSQEKLLLDQLNHPGIVKVFDFFEQDGFYYLVLEYIQGQSLDKLVSPISGVFLQEKVLLNWAMQLFNIFEYLHSLNPPIIYRDLKPSNVIKDRDGSLHLVDFGIARIYREEKKEDTEAMGTIIYASPEHFGGRQTDVRSDIFTIGTTLHFLATNGKNAGIQLFHFERVREFNPRLSENFERVLVKALEFNPDDRFQSVKEMREALISRETVSLTGEKPASSSNLDTRETVTIPSFRDTVAMPKNTSKLSTDTQNSKMNSMAILSLLLSYRSYIGVVLLAFLLIFLGVMAVKTSMRRESVSIIISQSPQILQMNPEGSSSETPVQGISTSPHPVSMHSASQSPYGFSVIPSFTTTQSVQRLVTPTPGESIPPPTAPFLPSSPGGYFPGAFHNTTMTQSGPERTHNRSETSEPPPCTNDQITDSLVLEIGNNFKSFDFERIDFLSYVNLFGVGGCNYKLKIPQGYFRNKLYKPYDDKILINLNEFNFARIDPGNGQTLRFIFVSPSRENPVVWKDLATENLNKILESHGHKPQALEPINEYGGIKSGQGIQYSFYLRDYPVKDRIFRFELIGYTVKEERNICLITVAALKESFNNYRGEFRKFINDALQARCD